MDVLTSVIEIIGETVHAIPAWAWLGALFAGVTLAVVGIWLDRNNA
jgi:hypothetical protein